MAGRQREATANVETVYAPGHGSMRPGVAEDEWVTCVAAGPTRRRCELGGCDWVAVVLRHALCQQAQPLCSPHPSVPEWRRSVRGAYERCGAPMEAYGESR